MTPRASVKIQVGFEVGTAEPVMLGSPAHTIITGMTGHGKTALVDALAARWPGQRFVVFLTKEGEEQFETNPRIKPYYKQKSTDNWRFLRDLLEVSEGRKLRQDESALLAQLTPGTKTLDDVLEKVEERLEQLTKKKQTESYKYNLYYLLKEYLKKLIDDIAKQDFSSELNLKSGVNVMDLSKLSRVMQSAVIGATLEEIHKLHRDTSPVIPEAWTFLPAGRGSPALEPAEFIVRQGRVKGNYLIIDTQDLAGVNGERIRSNIHNYFLGRQQYEHEVDRTLGALSLPPADKPRKDQIMRLKKGQFYAVLEDEVKLIYAWPVWLTEGQAKEIAKVGSDQSTPYPEPQKSQRPKTIPTEEWAETTRDYEPAPDAIVGALEAKVQEQQLRIAALEGDVKRKDDQIAELTKNETVEKERADRLLAEVDDFRLKRQMIADYLWPVIKDYLQLHEITGLLRPDGSTPHSTEITVENVDVVVTETTRMEKLDESTTAGKICILLASGEWKGQLEPGEIVKLLQKNWDFEFVRNGPAYKALDAELQKLALRPYLLIEKQGKRWVPTEKGKNIRKEALVA